MTTTESNHLTRWAGRKPVCVICGGQVSRPTKIRTPEGEKLRGDCAKDGRVDAEWVSR